MRILLTLGFAMLTFISAGQSFTDLTSTLSLIAHGYTGTFGGAGTTFFDYNNDGRDDLIRADNGDMTLWRAINGGNFTAVANFPNTADIKMVSFVDYDNNGSLDICMTGINVPVRLYKNVGVNQYSDVGLDIGILNTTRPLYGHSWADYDNDGDLDLYVCNRDVSSGARNYFYKNNDGIFEEIAQDLGIGNGARLSFQSVWFDYDNDNDVDLYVINDLSFENTLYRNNGDSSFTDVSAVSGTNVVIEPMSVTIGDYNLDGFLDIYMTNVPTGNVLLMNNGDGSFTDMAAEAGVELFQMSWGASYLDFDNDSNRDLFVTTSSAGVDPLPNVLYQSNGDGTFSQLTDEFTTPSPAFSCAVGDYNNDGFPEIATNVQASTGSQFWTSAPNGNNYIKLRLAGTVSNSQGIGSRISVFLNGTEYIRQVLCGENYLSQNSPWQVFGLDTISAPDSVKVLWPSGFIDTYFDLAGNTRHTLTEGETYAATLIPDGNVVLCPGDSVLVSFAGSGSILWSTGESSDTISVNVDSQVWAQLTHPLGFTAQTDTLQITFSTFPVISGMVQESLCFGDDMGSISLSLEGNLPLEVLWSTGDTTQVLDSLTIGTYSVTVMDPFGCPAEAVFELLQPEELLVTLDHSELAEEGMGIASLNISGGTEPYVVLWDETEGDVEIDGLSVGLHQVEVIDVNGCSWFAEFEIGLFISVEEPIDPTVKWSVYPNPVGEMLFLENHDRQAIHVELYDLSGRLLVTWRAEPGRNSFDLSNYPASGYLLCANGDCQTLLRSARE